MTVLSHTPTGYSLFVVSFLFFCNASLRLILPFYLTNYSSLPSFISHYLYFYVSINIRDIIILSSDNPADGFNLISLMRTRIFSITLIPSGFAPGAYIHSSRDLCFLGIRKHKFLWLFMSLFYVYLMTWFVIFIHILSLPLLLLYLLNFIQHVYSLQYLFLCIP